MKNYNKWMLGVLLTLIVGCSGDSKVKDFVDVPDVSLTSLQITEGGELSRSGEEVASFDSQDTGPYTVILENDSITTIKIQATLSDPANNSLNFVRVNRANSDEELIPASSGEEKALTVKNGVNLFYARVSNNETEAESNYTIYVYRTSDSARLLGVVVEGGSSEAKRVDPNPDFKPEITEYWHEINKDLCDVSLVAYPESRQAQVTVDGVVKRLYETTYFPLDSGTTRTIPIKVVSENGQQETTYTVHLTRKTRTQSELEKDTRIKSLSIEGGRTYDHARFLCDRPNFAQLFPNSVTSTSITAVVAGSGATMVIGNAVLDEDGNLEPDEDNKDLYAIANEEPLVSGEPYTGELLNNLEVGNNYFIIRVTSGDGDKLGNYIFNAYRSSTNGIFVSTSEELQQALRNAQPNDEINVATGDYVGIAGEETSGHAEAHFYSNASGSASTEEEEGKRIVLRGESGQVRLMGAGLSENAVLMLQGDNWIIENITLSDAQNGLVLDGASNVEIRTVGVLDVGERGIVMQNGSSDNLIRGAAIDRTGLLPREGTEEVYGEAIVLGGGETVDENNDIRYVSFGRNVLAEAVDVKANAVNTNIQFNTFNADNTFDIATPIANRSLINIEGTGAMEITYNEFEYTHADEGDDNLASVISIGADETAHLEIYQNNVDLDNQALPFVNVSNLALVDVADNVRTDDGEITYSGNVNQSFTTPVYQIQSVLDESKCIGMGTVTVTVTVEETSKTNTNEDILMMEECANEPEQLWRVVHDTDGFVMIARNDQSNIKMSPRFPLMPETNPRLFVVYPREDQAEPPNDVFNDAYYLRWFMAINNDGTVAFINRYSLGYLTEFDISKTGRESDAAGNLLMENSIGRGDSQVFRLIRQQ